jgi:hypothetical protein
MSQKMIWEIPKRRQIDIRLLTAIKSNYVCTRNVVRTQNMCSKEFVTSTGVTQGGVFTPLLFIIFMDKKRSFNLCMRNNE